MTRERWNDLILALFLLIGLGVFATAGIALLKSFWYTPTTVEKAPAASPFAQLDLLERGKLIFQSAGCTSCHLRVWSRADRWSAFPWGRA